ncbi:MarR family transcriptional regulator [Paraburkholderia sediminicola]|uniref:MarR family winged helix-turn-helix transcriptional regulator n=1 Tax=Paraburkholderia sediminicola TaxID=458836 RepID=UPI0038BC4379
MERLDESVGYLLSRVRSTMWNGMTQQTLAELQITATQASIVMMLASGRSPVAAELARECGLDASSVTRLIDRLERHGLLTRIRSDADRRMVRLALTVKGARVAAKIPPIFSRVMDSLFDGFTPEEIGFLKSMLRRVLANSDCLVAADQLME